MNKNVLGVLATICITVCGLLFQSCSDKDYYDPEKVPGYVSPTASDLDFSTSRSVSLNLNYNVPKGVVSVVNFYADYPLTTEGNLRSDITPVVKGINVTDVSNLSRMIPSYINKLYAYTPNLFVPMVSVAEITSNGIASFEPVIISVESDETSTRAGNAGDLWSRKSIYDLKVLADYYPKGTTDNFEYDIKEPDLKLDVPAEVLTYIGQTFLEEQRIPVESEFVRDATFKVVKGNGDKGAKMYVSILHAGSTIYNALSYFVYTGDKKFEELTKDETAKLEVITLFQLANANTNTFENMQIGLTPGKYIQLLYKNENGDFVEEFPVGAQIGWRLNVRTDKKPFNDDVFNLINGETRFSVPAWNDKKWGDKYKGDGDTNHTIQFEVNAIDGNTYKCFGFEDIRYNPDEDYNDLIFHVYSDPADAFEEIPSIPTPEIITIEDNYKGILAFEDQWPKKGDYDLNDVVVKYSSDVTYVAEADGSSDATVYKVVDTFSLIHSGATYNNGFSYKIHLSPEVINRITIRDENKQSETKYTSSQLTADGDGFIIDLCPRVKDVITAMEIGTKPQVYTVTMEFKNQVVGQDDFAKKCAPYNPFIIANGISGVEVHLPMYPPTDRADKDLFHTEDDRSDKNTRWYVSGDNVIYPFAIHLADADDFRIPQDSEGKEISKTYPGYLEWVESGMSDSKAWYK